MTVLGGQPLLDAKRENSATQTLSDAKEQRLDQPVVVSEDSIRCQNANASKCLALPNAQLLVIGQTTANTEIPSSRRLDPNVLDLQAFKDRDHSLRISASEVASLTGFHPYRSLPEALLNHVYQGSEGKILWRHDAELLGLQLVSDEQALQDVASKAGEATLNAIKTALQVQKGHQKLASLEAVQTLKNDVIQKAKSSKLLSKREVKQLEEGARHSIYTGFGTAWEDKALDYYEKQCGWPVEDRNAELRTWPFQKHDSVDNGSTVQAICPAHVYRRFEGQKKPQSIVSQKTAKQAMPQLPPAPTGGDEKHAEILAEVDTMENSHDVTIPFFSIRGSVDGLRDELRPNDSTDDISDDDSWVLRRILVECKHRMTRIQPVPPLYEQIQTSVYCFMYDVEDADILQVLREKERREENKSNKRHKSNTNEGSKKNKEKESDLNNIRVPSIIPVTTNNDSNHQLPQGTISTPQDKSSVQQEANANKQLPLGNEGGGEVDVSLRIAVTRVTLDDPVMKHRENWTNVILPRLRQWVDAVYAVRQCDDKRYQLLHATSDPFQIAHGWEILFHECPWLRHCDTSCLRDLAAVADES